MRDEKWLPIPGFSSYAVSDTGRIKRVKPNSYGKYDGLIMRLKATAAGYIQCSLMQEGKRFTISVNRTVCSVFHGSPPAGVYHAAHGDGNNSNNHADNLRWATPSENALDKKSHGTVCSGKRHHSFLAPHRVARGSRVGTSKLTEADVIQIRADPRSRSEISAAYGIIKTHVNDIRSRRAWKHLP